MTQESRLTRVYRAGSAIEATFLKGLLEQEGIPVRVFGETESTAFPSGTSGTSGAGGTTEIEIHVPEPLADAARKVIEDYESRTAGEAGESQTPWLCRRCGEENESSFDTCWNCHADRGR
jgi:hypothetical protein